MQFYHNKPSFAVLTDRLTNKINNFGVSSSTKDAEKNNNDYGEMLLLFFIF